MPIVKIAFLGDLMCGDSFFALGSGVASNIKRKGDAFMDPALKKILGAHTIVLANIEAVLSDIGRKETLRSLSMRGDPDSALLIRKWGITIANLANNHIFEQGREAARETAECLARAGISVIGNGRDGDFGEGIKTVEFTIGRETFAFIGICLRQEKYAYNGGGSVEETVLEIAKKRASKRTVIVSVHWGNEYVDRPSAGQRETAQRFIGAGAIAVIGHHSHVPHGIHTGDGHLIAYSLGNAIFDGFYTDTDWSFVLSVSIKNNRIVAQEIIPIQKDSEHRPCLALGKRKEALLAEMERRNALVSRSEWEEDTVYRAMVERENKAFKRKLRKTILGNLANMPLNIAMQIFLRPLKRRLGLW